MVNARKIMLLYVIKLPVRTFIILVSVLDSISAISDMSAYKTSNGHVIVLSDTTCNVHNDGSVTKPTAADTAAGYHDAHRKLYLTVSSLRCRRPIKCREAVNACSMRTSKLLIVES